MEILKWISDEALLEEFLSDKSLTLLFVFIGICFFLLCKGADWMVDGVVALARRTGLPEVVIGATVVSLGTTMPEAFVSVMAAFTGNPGLALGNGVGSIIADTGLIFGVTCLFAAIPMNRYILNRTGWVQIFAAVLLVGISLYFWITSDKAPVLPRWVGFFFIGLLCLYLLMSYFWAKQSDSVVRKEKKPRNLSMGMCWIMIVSGLVFIIVGARVLIPSVSQIALRFHVPEEIIAATMVALGTSLPELMTAIIAVRKGHPEIVVGNVVGADVLNCLFVIGAAACAKPLAVPHSFFVFHFPAMLVILFSFRIFIGMNRDGRFKRWQGLWLLGLYASYIVLQYVFKVGH